MFLNLVQLSLRKQISFNRVLYILIYTTRAVVWLMTPSNTAVFVFEWVQQKKKGMNHYWIVIVLKDV